MNTTQRICNGLLWSLAIAWALILGDVGASHSSEGTERMFTYPLLYSLLPAFCIYHGINRIFRHLKKDN